jgi:hypothetical protein
MSRFNTSIKSMNNYSIQSAGDNTYGQLGDGTTTSTGSAVYVISQEGSSVPLTGVAGFSSSELLSIIAPVPTYANTQITIQVQYWNFFNGHTYRLRRINGFQIGNDFTTSGTYYNVSVTFGNPGTYVLELYDVTDSVVLTSQTITVILKSGFLFGAGMKITLT